MFVTSEYLARAGLGTQVAARFVEAMEAVVRRFEIDRPVRLAAFLAQCHAESARFTRLSENLNYMTAARLMKVWPSRFRTAASAAPYIRNPEALANLVYAGRLGNGSVGSGDGWRYRGRGLIQLTGKANYREAATALGRPYVESPNLVAEPMDACLTAAWFWQMRGCNPLADRGDIDGITRRINGPAMLDSGGRRRQTERFMAALTIV